MIELPDHGIDQSHGGRDRLTFDIGQEKAWSGANYIEAQSWNRLLETKEQILDESTGGRRSIENARRWFVRRDVQDQRHLAAKAEGDAKSTRSKGADDAE
jgi:hypothetical protein